MAKSTEKTLAEAIDIQRKAVSHSFVEISHAKNGFWMIQTSGYTADYGRQAHGQTLRKAVDGFLAEWSEQ